MRLFLHFIGFHKMNIVQILLSIFLASTFGEVIPLKRPYGLGNGLTSCNSTSPINSSHDICGDICDKSAICCPESGACICPKEPIPTMLGGNFIHCTNWMYVDQDQCRKICQNAQKSDSRVCWTFTIGNFCTCFGNTTSFN